MASPSSECSLQATLEPSSKSIPRFFLLPREIKNMIYELVFYEVPGRCGRKGLVTPSALRTCRQMHEEALPFMYSMNRFDIAIEPDILKHVGAPRLSSSTTPLRNLSYIKEIRFDLQVGLVPMNVFEPAVNLTDWQIETQLETDIPRARILFRRACMSLINSGAILHKLEVFSCMIWEAQIPCHVDLLDCLKEVPVLETPCVGG